MGRQGFKRPGELPRGGFPNLPEETEDVLQRVSLDIRGKTFSQTSKFGLCPIKRGRGESLPLSLVGEPTVHERMNKGTGTLSESRERLTGKPSLKQGGGGGDELTAATLSSAWLIAFPSGQVEREELTPGGGD